jgi:hypothetical protein
MNPEITGRYAEVQGHRLYMDTGGDPGGRCLSSGGLYPHFSVPNH